MTVGEKMVWAAAFMGSQAAASARHKSLGEELLDRVRYASYQVGNLRSALKLLESPGQGAQSSIQHLRAMLK